MRRWLGLSNYRSITLFLAAGVCGGLFAWNSYNLLVLAMANFRFVWLFGRLALLEGGLWQMLEIAGSGYASLILYICFKACEVELIDRWRRWARRE